MPPVLSCDSIPGDPIPEMAFEMGLLLLRVSTLFRGLLYRETKKGLPIWDSCDNQLARS